mmetsp:Transcript_25786/g.35915  ORF Transcript_25786/g.35915 Transcript_25786/m.35915 type:complete len:267 (+) Transcript_25786:93-893(+)|eukprot:CAMPEP_0184491934 /NCGR_PEP_ID=MMETSP0113_2-20130426/21794_1 /TAXON_ID=91329 /ORGANISM="Norrisiella sphaerica, Strain BC52" /LENGTH=266 /DNA_ID=CAMNT_0026876503 /DNA_START=99 /DNA_END=899 /DNA_ORIENTATION=+
MDSRWLLLACLFSLSSHRFSTTALVQPCVRPVSMTATTSMMRRKHSLSSCKTPIQRTGHFLSQMKLHRPTSISLLHASEATTAGEFNLTSVPESATGSAKPTTFKDRVLSFLGGGVKLDKQRLAALGMGCLLSYGFISNINVGVLTSIAWASFSMKTGLSPLDPGQWPKFVAVQVGLYAVVGNLLRPVRFGLAISISPLFNRMIAFLQRRFQVNKTTAIFLNVLFFNVIVNIMFMCSGIYLASKIAGVPAIPPGHPLDLVSKFRGS